jgi:protein SCO1/2
MGKKNFIWLFVAAIVLVPVTVFGIVKWYEREFTSLPVLGPKGHKISEFVLSDQSGHIISAEEWNNKIVVVNLFFTHCPSVCPKMIRNLKKVQQRFAGDRDLRLASFTVDPDRDSVRQLNRYASELDIRGNWQLLTGSKKEIYRLARKSFLIVATDGDGGKDDFIHSEQFVLIDGKKRVRGFYKGTSETEVNTLLRDIVRLKREARL